MSKGQLGILIAFISLVIVGLSKVTCHPDQIIYYGTVTKVETLKVKKWKSVEFKSSNAKYPWSVRGDHTVTVGDSVWLLKWSGLFDNELHVGDNVFTEWKAVD